MVVAPPLLRALWLLVVLQVVLLLSQDITGPVSSRPLNSSMLVTAESGVMAPNADDVIIQHKKLTPNEVSLVVAMICRNENVNFESNLAMWLHSADYFVFVMDDRNSDDSEAVIERILGKGEHSQGPPGKRAKGYQIIKNEFLGFGLARTLSLQKAWQHFPQASHVMIADPDWRPTASTINFSELAANNVDVYRFTIYDRNGYTTRQIDWLLRHRQGLGMRYHLHEVLNIGYYSWADVSWVVHEVEQAGTWHSDVGHTSSFDPKRYLFDLSMLAKDDALYHRDPHVDYYLGITHSAYVDKYRAFIDEQNKDIHAANTQALAHGQPSTALKAYLDRGEKDLLPHIHTLMDALQRRIYTNYDKEFAEQRWGALLTSAMHFDNKNALMYYNRIKAETYFKLCRDYSESQSECSGYLVLFHQKYGNLPDALVEVKKMMRKQLGKRAMMNTITDDVCTMPGIVNVALKEDLHNIYLAAVSSLKLQGGDGVIPISTKSSETPEYLALAQSSGYSKYIVLISKWNKENEICEKQVTDSAPIMPVVWQIITASIEASGRCLQAHLYVPDMMSGSTSSVTRKCAVLSEATPITVEELCRDPDLFHYLTNNQITMHPCAKYVEGDMNRQIECKPFNDRYYSGSEDTHVQQHGAYVGLASIIDIVHNVHGGCKSHVERGEDMKNYGIAYRVLFAEHFSTKNLFQYLRYVHDHLGGQVEVWVVANADTVKYSKSRIALCMSAENKIQVKYAVLQKSKDKPFPGGMISSYDSLLSFLKDYRLKINAQDKISPQIAGSYFDYIEYNGGISMSRFHSEELRYFYSLLASDGAIGVSYMAKNGHTEAMTELLKRQNTSFATPFSEESKRLVRAYLLSAGTEALAGFKDDTTLVAFQAGRGEVARFEGGNMNQTLVDKGVLLYQDYHPSEAEQLLNEHGFSVEAHIPAAYARPYDESEYYSVQSMRMMGVDQDSFVKNFMPSFRLGMYLSKRGSLTNAQSGAAANAGAGVLASSTDISITAATTTTTNATTRKVQKEQGVGLIVPEGRATIAVILQRHGGDNVHVHDRGGSLGATFASSEQYARVQRSLSFSTKHYSMPPLANFSYMLPWKVLPAMALLSNLPTFSHLVQVNVAFAMTTETADQGTKENNYVPESVDEKRQRLTVEITREVTLLLDFLERFGMVLFVHNQAGSDEKRHRLVQARLGSNGAGYLRASVPGVVPVAAAAVSASTDSNGSATILAAESVPKMTAQALAEVRLLADKTALLQATNDDLRAELEAAHKLTAELKEDLEEAEEAKPATVAAKEGREGEDSEVEFQALHAKIRQLSGALETMAAVVAVDEQLARQMPAPVGPSLPPPVPLKPPAAVPGSLGDEFQSAAAMFAARNNKEPPKKTASTTTATTVTAAEAAAAAAAAASGAQAPRSIDPQPPHRTQTQPTSKRSPSSYVSEHFTQAQLLETHRGTKCADGRVLDDEETENCRSMQQGQAVKQYSSLVNLACRNKLQFDTRQFEYIAKKKPQLKKLIQSQVLPIIQQITAVLLSRSDYPHAPAVVDASGNDISAEYCSELSGAEMGHISNYINRAFLYSREPKLREASLLSDKAQQNLSRVGTSLGQHDYAVIDHFLSKQALNAMSTIMLMSTIWFDVSNRHMYFAHHNDGLSHEAFYRLANEVAGVMSSVEEQTKYQIVKYFATANDLSKRIKSPILMVEEGQVAVIIWLTPIPASEKANTFDESAYSESATDRLNIYSSEVTGLLAEQTEVNPIFHETFPVLKNTHQFAEIGDEINDQAVSVSRQCNRALFVGAMKPMMFAVDGGGAPGTVQPGYSFDASTMHALIIILEKE